MLILSLISPVNSYSTDYVGDCTPQNPLPYSGVSLKMIGPCWMPSGGFIAGKYTAWMRAYADCYENRTGAVVTLDNQYGCGGMPSFDAEVEQCLGQGILCAGDAFMYYPGNMWVSHVDKGHIQDLTDLVALRNDQIQWSGIYPSLRNSVATYKDRVWSIPVDGNALHVVYYEDLLASEGFSHFPEDWSELLEVTKKFTGANARPDKRGSYGGCFYTDPNQHAESFFFTVLSSYLIADGTFGPEAGVWMDAVSLKPKFANPAGRKAVRMWHDLVQNSAHAAIDQIKVDFPQHAGAVAGGIGFFEMITWFLEGKCLWMAAYPGNIKEVVIDFMKAKATGETMGGTPLNVTGEINVWHSPGSREVANVKQAGAEAVDTWDLVECTSLICPNAEVGQFGANAGKLINRAPFYGAGGGEGFGMHGVYPKTEEGDRKRLAVFDFLAYLASPEVSQVGVMRSPLDPFRSSHVDGLDNAGSAGPAQLANYNRYRGLYWSDAQLKNWKKTCDKVFNHAQVGMDLAIPGQENYRRDLTSQLQLVADGSIAPDAMVDNVVVAWHSRTAARGDVTQVNEYRAQLRLPPLSSCEPGDYYSGEKNDDGTLRCLNCPAGSSSSIQNQLSCDLCAVGHFQIALRSTECLQCGKGTFASRVGAVQCETCERGFYQDALGATDCKRCPGGRATLSSGSQGVSECLCPEGSYNPCLEDGKWASTFAELGSQCKVADGVSACVPCPEGVMCRGFGVQIKKEQFEDGNLVNLGSSTDFPSCSTGDSLESDVLCVHAPPVPALGFWSRKANIYQIYDCMYPDRCDGGGFEVCTGNWEGDMCAGCPSGYAISGANTNICAKCEGGDFFSGCVVLLFMALLPLAAYYSAVRNQAVLGKVSASLGMGVLLQTCQYLALFGVLSLDLPEPLAGIAAALRFLTFDMSFGGMGCVIGNTNAAMAGFGFFLPFLGAAGVFLWGVVLSSLKVVPILARFDMDAAINATGILWQIFFISISLSSSSMFLCRRHPVSAPDGKELTSLSQFPDVVCGETDHTPFICMGVLGICLYVLLPLWGIQKVVASTTRELREIGHTTLNLRRYFFLVARFGEKNIKWASLYLFRSAGLAFVPVFFNTPGLQLTTFSLYCCVWAALFAYCQPWLSKTLGLVDLIVMVYLAVSAGWCLVYIENAMDVESARDNVTLLLNVLLIVTVSIVGLGVPSTFVAVPESVSEVSVRVRRYSLQSITTGKQGVKEDSAEKETSFSTTVAEAV